MAANGALLIDTPGLRSLGLTGEADLSGVFMDIAFIEQKCRFGDCGHSTEPRCAIREAIETGVLSQQRWSAYLKLRREIVYEKRKTNRQFQSEEKKRWARTSQDVRKK